MVLIKIPPYPLGGRGGPLLTPGGGYVVNNACDVHKVHSVHVVGNGNNGTVWYTRHAHSWVVGTGAVPGARGWQKHKASLILLVTLSFSKALYQPRHPLAAFVDSSCKPAPRVLSSAAPA